MLKIKDNVKWKIRQFKNTPTIDRKVCFYYVDFYYLINEQDII